MAEPSRPRWRCERPRSAGLADLESLLDRLIRPRVEFTPETAAEFRNLALETDWGQLDCLGEILGVGGYDEVLARSVEVELPRRSLPNSGLS
jgi:hypothetical protein